MKTDDLDTPWFVVEEKDARFPDVTWQRICYQSDFGPTEISSLQCLQDYPNTHRRRRMAYPSTPLRACTEPAEVTSLMAAAPALYEALRELFNLLEEHQPSWYLRSYYNMAANALTGTELPEEAT
jgi:hypothetical protein